MKIVQNSTCSVVAAVSLFVSFFSAVVFAANTPPPLKDTMWVDVTFFDFHSDSSNPEFEIAPINATGHTKMVADSLDYSISTLPVPIVGSVPYFNQRIDRWFRPWKAGDFKIYNYYNLDSAYRRTRYQRYSTLAAGSVTLPHDTSFKNIPINDRLPFLLVNRATGTYQFADSTFFPLDGQGFRNEGRSHNYSFSMVIHQKFTKVQGLTFEFTGDDDVWAFVGNKLRMDLGGIHGPLTGTFDLDREADLKNDSAYTLDFFYVERHVTGSNIKITTNIVSPIAVVNIITPGKTVCALDLSTLVANVTDNVTGPRPDLAEQVHWEITQFDGQPETLLRQNVGASVQILPTVAYSTIKIYAWVMNGNVKVSDSAIIYVPPCDPKFISIEAGPVDTTNLDAKRHPQPLAKISILNEATTGQGYAVARDSSGAYVRPADPLTTNWSIIPQGVALATAAGQPNKKYIGIVTRIGDEGNTYAVAEEPKLRPDSVYVEIAPWYFVRIELRDPVTGAAITSIKMEQKDTARYDSWGLKSTYKNTPEHPNAWARIGAAWNLKSDSIKVVIPPPARAQSWTLDPKTPGSGSLILTNPDDTTTETLTVPVVIDRTAPSYAKITLLTPEPRRAGDSLIYEVRIFNDDSLVPGTYCFGLDGNDTVKNVYRDTLGTGGGIHPLPTIRVEKVDTLLNVQNKSIYSVNQCFNGGIDTVKVVLFYAPFNTDSFHQVSVTLGGKINAISEKFILLPSYLTSLQIEDAEYNRIPAQTLTGKQSVIPYSDGYDKYGNRIGFIKESMWSSTESLTRIHEQDDHIFVSAENVPEDQKGNVCATVKSPIGSDSVKACLPITIIGPKKVITSALTRDLDGNGCLDAIEIHFDRTVSLSEIATTNFTNIKYSGNVQFQPTKITQLDASTIVLNLTETETNRPQTDWLLYFDIAASTTIGAAPKVMTTDGAGPVVWKATKDNSSNIVKLELSERVRNITGSLITINDTPAAVFNVYRINTDGKFIEVSVFNGINGFTEIRNDSIFIFPMAKGQDLSTYNYINLDVLPPLAQDTKTNKPHPDNIKRQVKVIGQVNKMEIAPNPTRASFSHTGPNTFNLKHSDTHWESAKEHEGVLIRVTITPDSMMNASLKIYDMAGNLVEYTTEQDFANYLEMVCKCLANQKEASKYVLDFYWNGSNHQGMKVSPGIYKVIFYLDYQNSALTDVRLEALLGISK